MGAEMSRIAGTDGDDRRSGSRGLAGLLARVLTPSARARGFAEASIFTEWPRIVGSGLARRCTPVQLRFPRGRSRHATLVLAAGGGTALELRHLAPQILERINAFFGRRTVARLQFTAAALTPPPPAAKAPREASAPLPAVRLRELERALDALDPPLRQALFDLGQSVLGGRVRSTRVRDRPR